MTNKQEFQFTIESGKEERHYWIDLWRYIKLFYILAWRDITVQYKQTIMGVSWAVMRPLLTMLILVMVFGKIANLPSECVPYPIFVFTAMIPWTFFTTAFQVLETVFNMTEPIVSITVVSLLCIFDAIYFRKTAKTFADVI